MEIIQHHEPVDFNAIFAEKQRQQIGPDFNEFATILHTGDEVHSFCGSAEWKDRVYNALGNAYASDEAVELLNHSVAILICIMFSPETDRPLDMTEIKRLDEVISGFPRYADVIWVVIKDNTLGNVVKTYTLVSVNHKDSV